jgi:hypothetical protein
LEKTRYAEIKARAMARKAADQKRALDEAVKPDHFTAYPSAQALLNAALSEHPESK